MKLSENARKHFDNLYLEKSRKIRAQFNDEQRKLEYATLGDPTSNQPTVLFNRNADLTKRLAKALAEAHVISFIETYQMISECPDEEDVREFTEDHCKMIMRHAEPVARKVNSLYLPLPGDVKEGLLKKLTEDLRVVAYNEIPRLRSFMTETALRSEQSAKQSAAAQLLAAKLVSASQKFFPKGKTYDAFVEIRNIFQKATSSVEIIDPWVDGTLFQMLAAIPAPSLKIEILSFQMPKDFSLEAKKFVTQYPHFSLEIRATKEFHDRFVILDGKDCYHIGASIKDAGSKVFMISRFEDQENIDALIKQKQQSWATATLVPF